MMRDLKLILDHDPNRKALAAEIGLEAGARRDLQLAGRAAELAAARHWEAQSKLDELHKAGAVPSGALAADFIASVGAGSPCGTAVLERSAIDARAQIAAVETDVRVWEETQRECELAVRAREADVAAAKERVEGCARAVVCNAAMIANLVDKLAVLQSEVINRRSALRCIWRMSLNGEIGRPLSEQVQSVLQRDLLGLDVEPQQVVLGKGESADWRF